MSRKPSENRGGSRRLPRVENEIRDVIGRFLLSGFKTREVGSTLSGFISVTRVIASGDLRQAKVYVTAMGRAGEAVTAASDKKAIVLELQSHAHEIQNELNRKLQMKHCPRLTFFFDEGFEHALKVENILRGLSGDSNANSSDEN